MLLNVLFGIFFGLFMLAYLKLAQNISYLNGRLDKINDVKLNYDLGWWKFFWHVNRKATK